MHRYHLLHVGVGDIRTNYTLATVRTATRWCELLLGRVRLAISGSRRRFECEEGNDNIYTVCIGIFRVHTGV